MTDRCRWRPLPARRQSSLTVAHAGPPARECERRSVRYVIGEKAHRGVGQHLLAQRLASDARLQRSANGARRSSRQTKFRRPSTVPSGRCSRCRDQLGKRSVTSSSPRPDEGLPPRRTICARMPSYFHSTSHRSPGPVRSQIPLRQSAAHAPGKRMGWPDDKL